MMEKTWRWFGPSDKVTLEMMRQIARAVELLEEKRVTEMEEK